MYFILNFYSTMYSIYYYYYYCYYYCYYYYYCLIKQVRQDSYCNKKSDILNVYIHLIRRKHADGYLGLHSYAFSP